VELIIEMSDEREFVEHILDQRALDGDLIQSSWYAPEEELAGEAARERQRFYAATQVAIDWLLQVGNNAPLVMEQVSKWYLGGWYYHMTEMRPDEGRPLRRSE
jgi:hypothetical protein